MKGRFLPVGKDFACGGKVFACGGKDFACGGKDFDFTHRVVFISCT